MMIVIQDIHKHSLIILWAVTEYKKQDIFLLILTMLASFSYWCHLDAAISGFKLHFLTLDF